MGKGLHSCEPFRGVHFEEAVHELERFVGQLSDVLLLEGLWFADIGEFVPYEAWVPSEFFLLGWGKRAKDLGL